MILGITPNLTVKNNYKSSNNAVAFGIIRIQPEDLRPVSTLKERLDAATLKLFTNYTKLKKVKLQEFEAKCKEEGRDMRLLHKVFYSMNNSKSQKINPDLTRLSLTESDNVVYALLPGQYRLGENSSERQSLGIGPNIYDIFISDKESYARLTQGSLESGETINSAVHRIMTSLLEKPAENIYVDGSWFSI